MPKNKIQLQRISGMFNYLNKFLPNLCQMTKSLRTLLKKEVKCLWANDQYDAFDRIKDCLTSLPVLKYDNVSKYVTLSVEASSGPGMILLQKAHQWDM